MNSDDLATRLIAEANGNGSVTLSAEDARTAGLAIRAAQRARAEAMEEADKLRRDLSHASDAALAACERCGAPLFEGDEYVSDPDGISGCWASMTKLPPKQQRRCYAYRTAAIRQAAAGEK